MRNRVGCPSLLWTVMVPLCRSIVVLHIASPSQPLGAFGAEEGLEQARLDLGGDGRPFVFDVDDGMIAID